MAFTANTAQTHVILDTAQKYVVKCMYYSPDKVAETDVLKVNAETLTARTFKLTVANTANAKFQPNDIVTGNVSNASAFVSTWDRLSNTLVVVDISGNTAFDATDTLTIARTADTVPLSAVATPARGLQLVAVNYSISDIGAVEIGAGGVYANSTPYVHPVLLLHDVGIYGADDSRTPGFAPLPNPALNPTGNYYISTYAPNAAHGINYTIIMQFRKTFGYTGRNVY